MGTNFYRLPKQEEFDRIKQQVINSINKLSDFSFAQFPRHCFCTKDIVDFNYKDEEGYNIFVHLGKRSAGWKFLWNFHRNKFYSNKEELLNFIKNGRVFDEYGQEYDSDEFIEMALNWYKNGLDSENDPHKHEYWRDIHDLFIDGLRVANANEESTYFC